MKFNYEKFTEKIKQNLRELYYKYEKDNEFISEKLNDNNLNRESHLILVNTYNNNIEFMKKIKSILLEQ